MANESWDDDFTMSDASDCNSGIDRQLEMVPGQPSATSFQSDRLNETSLELLQTGASFEVGSNDNQPWTNNYQESFDGTLYWSETTTPHLHMVSNGPDDGFLQSGELAGSCVTDNSLLESNHPQMVYNDDNDWRSDNGYRTALPTFNFEHDSGTPSARQPLDVGQGSNDWYHNPPFRQTEPGTDDFSDQFVAGNMNFLPGEPQQHADSFDGNKLQSHNPNMYDQSDSNSAHPPPWNPLGLHATQSVAPRCPTCTFSASSSRGSTATHCSCSLLSYTGTIITTPDSAYTGVVEGSDTAWDTVSGGDMYQSSQYGLGSFGRGHSVVHGTQDRFHMSEAQAGLLSPHLDAGRIPRSHRSVHGRTEASSSVVSPASIALSFDSRTLYCPYDGCLAKFKGPHGRGNRNRHKRLKHTLSGNHEEYPCEVSGCGRIYLRKDARLKHYRNRHADALHTGPPKARKSTGQDNNMPDHGHQL